MEVKLVGIHKVKRKLANGKVREHFYAWRGGPKMKEEPGTRAFTQEYIRLTRTRQSGAREGTFAEVLDAYRASPLYAKLRAPTKRSYEPILAMIRLEYGDLPIRLLSEKGMRREFERWRDTMADRPRTADMHMAVLARVLSWAVKNEIIGENKAKGFDKLYESARAEIVWTPAQCAALEATAPPHVLNAYWLAIETGQRQLDLLRLTWAQYNDGVIRLKQSKTKRDVSIRLPDHLQARLATIKRADVGCILLNSRGEPWTSDGFRSSWAAACKAAGVEGVTFHDLRGTFVSRKYADGWSIKEIAQASGHAEKDAESIIRRHYLATDLTGKARTNGV